MDANKTHREKATWELHKNSMSLLEQILEATHHKITVVWPLTSHLKSHPSKTKRTCRTSKEELISDVLLWTSTRGHISVGRPGRTYLHQLCADTGCSLEDRPGAIDDREGW